MTYILLLSGHKPTFELFTFEPSHIPTASTSTSSSSLSLSSDTSSRIDDTGRSECRLSKIGSPEAPPSVTWLERSPTVPNLIYGTSESEDEVYSFVVDTHGIKVGSRRKLEVRWPVHFAISNDGSGLVTGGLGSGDSTYIPLDPSGAISQTSSSPILTNPDPYPYAQSIKDNVDPHSPLPNNTQTHQNNSEITTLKPKPAPEPALAPKMKSPFGDRQTGPHVHGLTFSKSGTAVYICDLGSDLIWRAEVRDRDGADKRLEMTGKFESQRGITPRHAVLSDDENYLYVNSELQSQLLIYSTTTLSLLSTTDLTPPDLPRPIRDLLLTAEIYLHPHHPRTLYISLRGTQQLSNIGIPRGDPHLPPPPSTLGNQNAHEGDSIVVVLLDHSGSTVREVKYHQTRLDWIRGMRISDDGAFLAAAGEFGGGLEIYGISGERGELLNLVARDQSVKNVNCVLWL